MKYTKFYILLLFSIIIISCKNYYNETIAWADTIESELNIEDVKSIQPNYIEIDWENPQDFEDEKWFLITKIKGNIDVLAMSHYLVFVNNKYHGRESKK